MKKIYLAGPTVFLRESSAAFMRLEALCARFGLQGMRPCDEAIQDSTLKPAEVARRIYLGNINRIKTCDAVLADLTPFRGRVEPDSGTAFELGFASAIGLPISMFLDEANCHYRERVSREIGVRTDERGHWDTQSDMLVEDFGYPVNLMLSCCGSIHVDAESAIRQLAQRLGAAG